MSYPLYFVEIKLLIEQIAKLEQEFSFCVAVKDYEERKQIEIKLGSCYRKLMNSVKKEGLQKVWIEHGVLQFMLVNSGHSTPTNDNS